MSFQGISKVKNVKNKLSVLERQTFMLAIYVGNKWRTIYGNFLVREAIEIYRHV